MRGEENLEIDGEGEAARAADDVVDDEEAEEDVDEEDDVDPQIDGHVADLEDEKDEVVEECPECWKCQRREDLGGEERELPDPHTDFFAEYPGDLEGWEPEFGVETRYHESVSKKQKLATMQRQAGEREKRRREGATAAAAAPRSTSRADASRSSKVMRNVEFGMDSCCSVTQSYRRDLLHDIRKIPPIVLSTAGSRNEEGLVCDEVGIMRLRFFPGGQWFEIEVLVNPRSPLSLFALADVHAMMDEGEEVHFRERYFYVAGRRVELKMRDGLPFVALEVALPERRARTGRVYLSGGGAPEGYKRAHKILLHLNPKIVEKTARRSTGLGHVEPPESEDRCVCSTCQLALQKAPRKGQGNLGVLRLGKEEGPARLM